jgi:N-methylhydantoinase A
MEPGPLGTAQTLGVDVGGTFTDVVCWDGRRLRVGKLSTTTGDQSVGVAEGARQLLDGAQRGGDLPRLLHGTTVATNALLERRGARTALVTDPGFEDVIEIGRQDRPSLYDPFDDRPAPLVPAELRFGISPPGGEASVAAAAAEIVAACAAWAIDAIAVCYLHAYRDGGAEAMLRDHLAGHAAVPVSISSEVVAEFREYERMSTTVLNAFLAPEVGRYTSRLAGRVGRAGISQNVGVMRSSGGIVPLAVAAALPAAILLSGPAGGVVAAARLGEQLGDELLVSFDMGGTSTDVCRIEGGRPEVTYQREIGGFACQLPAVAVHTVGAGGGSIAWIDAGGALRVGPQSAGASPGPACYGRGGTHATVTDANVLLGRLDRGAALAGSLTVRSDLAETSLAALGRQLGRDALSVAEGMVAVVESHMAQAIRAVSVEQGADPRGATLVAFGGAGGLHASALARELDMRRVIVPPFAGVFSALGLLLSPPRTDRARTVNLGAEDAAALPAAAEEVLAAACDDYVVYTGRRPDHTVILVDVRYVGQSHETPVPYDAGDSWDALAARFHDAHQRRNGFARRGDPVEAVTVRVAATGSPALSWDDLPAPSPTGDPIRGTRLVHTAASGPQDAVVYRWASIAPGSELTGPAVIEDGESTTFVGPGERAVVLDLGALEITW